MSKTKISPIGKHSQLKLRPVIDELLNILESRSEIDELLLKSRTKVCNRKIIAYSNSKN